MRSRSARLLGRCLVVGWVAGAAVAVVAGAQGASATPAIELFSSVGEDAVVGFAVTGLAPGVLRGIDEAGLDGRAWQAGFRVHVVDREGVTMEQPVLGSYRVDGTSLRFVPAFAPAPGIFYRVRLDLARLLGRGVEGDVAPIEVELRVPAADPGPPAVVEAVYPTADVLPANLLRMYIHFSAPMARGEAWRYVRLLDQAGEEVEAPFLALRQELWDPGQRRLTLFFDPGRVKRGLRPHQELGAPLEADATYRLVIDAGWHDASGRPLAAAHEKRFRTRASKRRRLDAATWQIEAPRATTRAPVVVRFPEPLDHGLLQRLIRVRDDAGRSVDGVVTIDREETRWHFTPDRPWREEPHTLDVDTSLEDPAGNNLRVVFDVDLEVDTSDHDRPARIELPWVVEPAP